MAIFNKKTEDEIKGATDAKAVKPDAKKDVPKITSKKSTTKKPSKDAGASLTKTPVHILKSPRITEKAAYMTMQSAYVFEVAMDATKRDVVAAVRALYNVEPRKVNMVVKKPRAYIARFRNRRGMKAGMKKAYVFLKKGEKIDIA